MTDDPLNRLREKIDGWRKVFAGTGINVPLSDDEKTALLDALDELRERVERLEKLPDHGGSE